MIMLFLDGDRVTGWQDNTEYGSGILVPGPPPDPCTDYRWDGLQYIYDPRPPEPEPEYHNPVDERLTALETTTDDIILMMAELIGGMEE